MSEAGRGGGGGRGRGRSGGGGGRGRDRDDRDDRDGRDRDRGDDRASEGRAGEGRTRRGKRKVDPFLADKTLKIDWRDPQLLSRFITERGKIVPRRVSGLTAKNQRKLKVAIKRARHMSIIPYGGHRTQLRNLS